MKSILQAVVAAAMLGAAAPALAQPVLIADSGDSAWTLAAALLVMLAALPGIALFYGRGRTGPTGLALIASSALASLLFVAIGFSLAFGDGSAILGNAANAMLANLLPIRDGTGISEGVFALFELTVALFAVGIFVGSVAEKSRPGWLLPFSGLWLLIVYVPVARWVWTGWLADNGVADFAGGIVVQTTAGVAALVVAFLLRAKGGTDVQHDSRIALAGAALMWVGWLGVIGGKIYGAGDDAGSAMLNAQVAASAAVIVGMALERWRTGTVSVFGVTNAALAGLAAVSTGADVVGVGGAMALGLAGAIAAWGAAAFVARMKLGSAASAFTIHGAPGMVGAVAFPVFILTTLGGPGFADGNGLVNSLVAQFIAVVAVALWAAVASAIAALIVSMVVPMRGTAEGI